MSLTQPPPPDPADDVDRPPSRRFTILFTLAMVVIAAGYMWVWHAKTSRTVAEPPPPLVLGTIASDVPPGDPAADAALRDSVVALLHTIPGLEVYRSIGEVPPPKPVPGGLVPPVYALTGALARETDGEYRLAVERTDARTDSLLYIYRVRGPTVSEVVYRMAVQIAMSFGLPHPSRDSAALRTGNRMGS